QRADAPPHQLLRERLDADADERRERAVLHAGGDFARGGGGVAVLLVVGTVAVSVLEVDAEVFHRFAAKLLDDARVNRLRLRAIDADGGRERRAVRRVLLKRAQRELAQLLRRVGLEQLRAAVDRVHRLARGRVAGN